eukprot:gene6077-6152_t
MLFPGPKLNTLFRSRWNALLWGAGVLLTAYCSVPSQEESKEEAAATPAISASGSTASGSTAPATSPWARDPAKPAQ